MSELAVSKVLITDEIPEWGSDFDFFEKDGNSHAYLRNIDAN